MITSQRFVQEHSLFLERLNGRRIAADREFEGLRRLPYHLDFLPECNNVQQPNSLSPLLDFLLHTHERFSIPVIYRAGYSQIESFYHQVVIHDLILQNPIRKNMELPLGPKVVLNITSKRFAANRKELLVGLAAVLVIAGQRGQPTTARKSIAAFKLREGSPLGCKVTLRGKRGYSILDKLVTFVLPRGYPSRVSGTVDKAGNWGVGITDPLLFVELEGQYDLFRSLEGIDASIVISGGRRRVALLLLSSLQILL